MVILLVIPELTSCVKFLLSEIPPVIEQLLKSQWVADILPADLLSQLSAIDWQSYASKLLQIVTSGLGSAMGVVVTAVSSVFSAIVTAFISIIFSVYLLSGKETLLSQSKRLLRNYLPAKWESRILHWLSVLNDCFRRYIVGQCTEAVILGVLCIIGMLIFQFPYAVMIGTLIGFTALVPVAGAYIGAGVGAIMILTESPVKALLFLVFILVLQQLEGNLIYPKVVGKSIGLPAIWVLAAVTIGGALMGILGMLIGVPIAAAIYRLVREDLQLREKQHAPAEENPS
jgi:predicted PurR-regulated permease PerM